jgi:hypothetical protein
MEDYGSFPAEDIFMLQCDYGVACVLWKIMFCGLYSQKFCPQACDYTKAPLAVP